MPIKGRLTAEMWVDMQEKKTVDVIIPVSYPDEKLQKILDRLEKQTHPVERIIVINTDEAGFPKNLRWFIILHQKNLIMVRQEIWQQENQLLI